MRGCNLVDELDPHSAALFLSWGVPLASCIQVHAIKVKQLPLLLHKYFLPLHTNTWPTFRMLQVQALGYTLAQWSRVQ